MNRAVFLQNLLYLVIIVLTVLVLSPLAPRPDLNVHGIFLPNSTGQSQQGVSKVTITNNVLPTTGQALGLMNTQLHVSTENITVAQHAFGQTLSYLVQLAKANGANYIVLTGGGLGGEGGALNAFMLTAKAFFVPPTK